MKTSGLGLQLSGVALAQYEGGPGFEPSALQMNKMQLSIPPQPLHQNLNFHRSLNVQW